MDSKPTTDPAYNLLVAELELALGVEPGDPKASDAAMAAIVGLRRAGRGTSAPPILDADEQEAMDHLLGFMGKVRGWGLRANEAELASAIHVLQGFVIQHMLRRLTAELPDVRWSVWYRSQASDAELGDVEDHPASATHHDDGAAA